MELQLLKTRVLILVTMAFYMRYFGTGAMQLFSKLNQQ